MKAISVTDNRWPSQIWNSAHRLADVPAIGLANLVPPGARAVIVSPHPGDEVIANGGLLQVLAHHGHPLQLISISDGSASHPGSQVWPKRRLSVFRPQESAEALRRLGLPLHSLKWIRGGFTDSALAEREQQLLPFITRYLRPDDVVFSTWRHDGNPDHEAVGRATAKAAAAAGAQFHEVPIWAWHWAPREEHQIPWERARKLRLDTWTVARKRHAAHAYASQLQGEPEIGLEPSLSPVLLERLRMPYEIILM
ncbi:PIG-L deacetylase family protein [Pseudomonas sp. LD120]|uniref:PIG-L deacetylase family protein n=1 Tax=Pseudomonas sp. LD120 TaxID=485751 RepID=UPI00135B1199|nr:PIG-L family deacetylase [Pseudomonas sp. LD120]KAF0866736.1 PIG-L family deacetylase [Pseudomonas sp. LD120]